MRWHDSYRPGDHVHIRDGYTYDIDAIVIRKTTGYVAVQRIRDGGGHPRELPHADTTSTDRIGRRTDIRPADGLGRDERVLVDAQIRALQFVRNLTPRTIERVIADVRSGKVRI